MGLDVGKKYPSTVTLCRDVLDQDAGLESKAFSQHAHAKCSATFVYRILVLFPLHLGFGKLMGRKQWQSLEPQYITCNLLGSSWSVMDSTFNQQLET